MDRRVGHVQSDDLSRCLPKTLAMVIPAKKPPGWQKGDPTRDPADYKRTPIHIPEPLQRPTSTTGPHRLCRQGSAPRRLHTPGYTRNLTRPRPPTSASPRPPGLLQAQDPRTHLHKQDVEEATGRDVSSLNCVCAVLLDSTETWAMSSSTFTVLRNALHVFDRALNIFKTTWDCERPPSCLCRLDFCFRGSIRLTVSTGILGTSSRRRAVHLIVCCLDSRDYIGV